MENQCYSYSAILPYLVQPRKDLCHAETGYYFLSRLESRVCLLLFLDNGFNFILYFMILIGSFASIVVEYCCLCSVWGTVSMCSDFLQLTI